MAIKKSYYKPVRPNYAIELRFKAQRGDESAMQELIERNAALAREANRRLTLLEKSDRFGNRWASRYAQQHIEEVGGPFATRYTTDKKLLVDPVDYQLNIQSMSKFLESKSSTIRGNREIDKNILNAFRNKGINISKDMEYEFIDFISSDEWEDLKKFNVPSGVLVSDMVRISDTPHVTLERFFEEMKKVADNSQTYDVALDNLGIPFI